MLAVGHGISCEAAIFGLDPGARMKMITCTLAGRERLERGELGAEQRVEGE